MSFWDVILDEEDADDPAHAFIAGAFAGTADILMHPLETLSVRAKVHPSSGYGGITGAAAKIFKEEGVRGFCGGLSMTLVASLPSTAVYFGAYEALKKMGERLTDRHPTWTPFVHFFAGGLADLFASVMFVPVDVVRCQLQLGANPSRATGGLVSSARNHKGPIEACRTIYRQKGLRGLFAGWNSSLLQDCMFSSFQFLIYEMLKKHHTFSAMAEREGRDLHSHESHIGDRAPPLSMCMVGGIAGTVAAALTNPIDVVTTRLQTQDKGNKFGQGMRAVWRVAVSEGAIGLWRGTVPRMIAAFPCSAVQFGVYELVLTWLKGDAEV